jgi:hypothetical protein
VEDFARRLNASWQSPAAKAPAPQKADAERVAAVQSLLSGCLSSLGLSKHLQVRRLGRCGPPKSRADRRAWCVAPQVVAARQGGGAAAAPARWDVDRTASARVPGGTLSLRVVTSFTPDRAPV